MKTYKRGLFIGIMLMCALFFGMAATYKTAVAPTTSTDNAIVRFNGTGGTYLQNSGVIVNDTNGVSGIADLQVTGTMTMDTFYAATLIVTNVTYIQTELQPHSSITNYVLDPTLGAYQLINSTNLVTKFLHATNVSTGTTSVLLISSGTNASVSVELPSNVKANTNIVSMGPNQILPITLYCYGNNNTNVLVTVGPIGR